MRHFAHWTNADNPIRIHLAEQARALRQRNAGGFEITGKTKRISPKTEKRQGSVAEWFKAAVLKTVSWKANYYFGWVSEWFKELVLKTNAEGEF